MLTFFYAVIHIVLILINTREAIGYTELYSYLRADFYYPFRIFTFGLGDLT